MTADAEKLIAVKSISTHTLTWSVTWKTSTLRRFLNDFNSHAHVERDTVVLYLAAIAENFNSHAHVERDGCVLLDTVDGNNFNSHAHVERDRAEVIV